MVARVFAASENGVQPVKTAVEIESDLITEYKTNLKSMIFQYMTNLKDLIGGWKKMKEWHFGQCCDIQVLMFCDSELGSKDLNNYKNSKSYIYYKSGWFQVLQYHNLSGSQYCIIREEYRKSQFIKDPLHKLWIILTKTAK